MDSSRQEGLLAVLFPGQGSQSRDMREQVERWQPDLVPLAAAAAGADPFEHAEESTRYAQPAIFCASLAAWRRLSERVQPDVMAGHSLGEIAALVAAGALGVEDGLRLVVARGRLMERAAEANGAGGMLAVQTTDRAGVGALAAASGLVVANENAPQQVVLSGPAESLERVERALRDSGVRTKRLAIRGAFHTPAMAAAVPRFRELLDGVGVREPRVPVFSGVTAAEFDDVRRRLAQALTQPVRWLSVVRALRNRGVTRFVETGPGRVLTALVRRTVSDAQIEPTHELEAVHA
jgi:[acyl-carrier-protein] S-malonyltransferase